MAVWRSTVSLQGRDDVYLELWVSRSRHHQHFCATASAADT
jgi:hypothetical protein|eukprot:COSAG01_NODE_1187_length_11337_cov_185.267574_6_plen_41_part_00